VYSRHGSSRGTTASTPLQHYMQYSKQGLDPKQLGIGLSRQPTLLVLKCLLWHTLGAREECHTSCQRVTIPMCPPSFIEVRLKTTFVNVDYKFLPRPQLAHFIFKYLPLIDENNKQRQSVLGLERSAAGHGWL
jgi:hypothetical protein